MSNLYFATFIPKVNPLLSTKSSNSVKDFLTKNNQSFEVIRYGDYQEEQFVDTLKRCKYCILINKCESQGIAVQEIMSCNLPILVLDYTLWDDRGDDFKIDATSVPYWDDTCGSRVTNLEEFENNFTSFINNLKNYNPREFILENLNINKSTNQLIEIL